MRTLTVTLPDEVFVPLVEHAKQDGDTLAEWIRDSVAWRLRMRLPIKARRQGAQLCKRCFRRRYLFSRGFCKPCYNSQFTNWPVGICRVCQEERALRFQKRRTCNRCDQRLRKLRKRAAQVAA